MINLKVLCYATLYCSMIFTATRADPADYGEQLQYWSAIPTNEGSLPHMHMVAVCPDTCKSSFNCHCASSKPPGALKPSEVPQFIVLTNDDAGKLKVQQALDELYHTSVLVSCSKL